MPVYPKPLYVEAGTYVSRADTINPTLCCEFYLKQSFILEELIGSWSFIFTTRLTISVPFLLPPRGPSVRVLSLLFSLKSCFWLLQHFLQSLLMTNALRIYLNSLDFTFCS